jgi:hypothetical protein
MYSSQRSASSEAPQSYDWAPQLLRFFQLLIGDQTAAERLTIDTVVEGAALAGVRLANGMSSALVHCAVMKASSATESTAPLEDKLVRAVKSLPFSQRLVVVLFRGLGLPLEEVATLAGISVRQARRLCADGLVAIHDSLAGVEAEHHSMTRKRTGEF